MGRAPLTAGSSRDITRELGYDIDLDHAIELIRKSNALRVGLQAPEGLKRATVAIAQTDSQRDRVRSHHFW